MNEKSTQKVSAGSPATPENESRQRDVSTQETGKRSRPEGDSRIKRWLIGGGVVLLAVIVLGSLTPWIVANTPIKDSLLQSLLPEGSTTIETKSAQFGWNRPVELGDLVVASEADGFRLVAKQVKLDKTWWQLLWDSPEYGELRLIQPELTVAAKPLFEPRRPAETSDAKPFRLTALVEDGHLQLNVAELSMPVLDVPSLNARGEIKAVNGNSVLTVGKTTFLDRYPLTPELCQEGLQLVAPVLADVSTVEGTVSLEFERLQFPLSGKDSLTEIKGTAQLHDVTTGLNNPILEETVAIVSELFGVSTPQTVQLARDAKVVFEVKNDRVYHEEIRFFLPAITAEREWTSSGSIGFDETIDLELNVPVPAADAVDSAVARLLSAKPLRLQIQGTLSDPELIVPENASLVQQLSTSLLGDGTEDADELLMDQVQAVVETGEAVKPLWDWTTEWLQGKDED